MTLDEKLWKLVQLLHQKTAQAEIAWEQTSQKNTYQTSFPSLTVRLQEISRDEGIDFAISIYNEAGVLVETATDEAIQGVTKDRGVFDKMQDLYVMARRSAMGVDKALDDLLAQLKVS